MTFTVRYHKSWEYDYAVSKVKANYDKAVTREKDYSLEQRYEKLCKFLGSVAYITIYTIPDYILEDGKVYSIENICYYFPNGILHIALHDMLEKIGMICCDPEPNPAALKQLLDESFIPEIASTLNIPGKYIFHATLLLYLELTRNTRALTRVKRITSNNNWTYSDLNSFYVKEVEMYG